MKKQMHKEQYFHFRAVGDVLVNDWIDSNDHSKGKSTTLKKNQILPNGGATVCYLPSSDGKARMGISFCSPRDNFKKETGRIKSKGKAVSVHNIIFNELLTFVEAADQSSQMVSQKRADVSKQNAKKVCNVLKKIRDENDKFAENIDSLVYLKRNKTKEKV